MFNGIKNRLQRNYINRSFEIQMKSLILFYWCVILILILLFLYIINLQTVHSIYSGPLFVLLIQISAIVISMFLLLSGSYESGVAALIVIMMAGHMLYIILSPPTGNITMHHINTFYYVFAIIVFCALFGNWKWLIASTASYFVFGISYFIYLSNRPSLQCTSMAGMIIDYNFSLLFVSSLCIIIKRINTLIISRLELYNERVKHEMNERIILEKEMMAINETVQYKIGQDLHDDLGQHLVAIKMRGEALKKLHSPDSAGDTTEIDAIIDLTNQAIKKTRRLLKGLGLIDLKAHNFIKALNDLALEINDTYHISCQFIYDELIIIYDDLMAINLYRIAQESIHNAIQHGKSKGITVNLFVNNDFTVMEIRDDGSGFRGKTDNCTGMGLRIMNYRANMIGGEIVIANSDTGGTTVTCTFKVKKP
jgi:signal transduction histidine kinase